MRRTGLRLAAGIVLVASGVTACSSPDEPTQGGTELVIADDNSVGGFNPVAGYAPSGGGKMYDGLVSLSSGDGLGGFEPALASSLPTADPSARVWTARLREGVTFSDGSAFDAADVAATYSAILDPRSASRVRTAFSMIDSVEAVDARTVRFELKYSYAPLMTKMLIGIVPSEALAAAGPAEESTLNERPIGTGPYRLDSMTSDSAVYSANPDYWGGKPAVEKLTVLSVLDTNTRAQRVASGELDGANLPPLLAEQLGAQEGVDVVVTPSADYRFVSMPAGDPVAGDPAVRKALNLAADREAMVASILGGKGSPASTPLNPRYGDFYEQSAVFPHDPDAARTVLDDAGWVVGGDGIRSRNGQRAAFTLMYGADDALRRDLSQAFASDARKVGIEVTLDGVSYDTIDDRVKQDSTLLGGGDAPYDPDGQLFDAWDSSYNEPGVGSDYDNVSDYENATVDRGLDVGRRSADPAERRAAYRSAQAAYVDDPASVYLVFLDHTYLTRTSDWKVPAPVIEPHSYGANWGPWYRLQSWER